MEAATPGPSAAPEVWVSPPWNPFFPTKRLALGALPPFPQYSSTLPVLQQPPPPHTHMLVGHLSPARPRGGHRGAESFLSRGHFWPVDGYPHLPLADLLAVIIVAFGDSSADPTAVDVSSPRQYVSDTVPMELLVSPVEQSGSYGCSVSCGQELGL